MVPLLLFLILLVLAWPLVAVFGGTLSSVLLSHLHIIGPTVLIVIVYVAFLAPIARRNNIKLGGRMGEALDPSKPVGPELQTQIHDNEERDLLVKPPFFSTPDQWKRVPRDLNYKPQPGQSAATAKPLSWKRVSALAALALVVAGPLTAVLLDRGIAMMSANGFLQLGPYSPAVAPQPIVPVGNWVVQPDQSATLNSSSGTNDLGQPITLTIWCNVWPDLKLDFHDYLGSDQGIDGYKSVILQVGAGSVQEFRMALGPDQTSLKLNGRRPDLIQSLITGGVFSVYTAPYNSEPVEAKFNLTGARAALEPLLNTCNPASR